MTLPLPHVFFSALSSAHTTDIDFFLRVKAIRRTNLEIELYVLMTNIILLGIFIQIIPVFISQQRLSKRVTLLQRAARFNFVIRAVGTSNSLNFHLLN